MSGNRKNKEKEMKLCLKCLKDKNKDNGFYNSYNSWHSDGKMPYCKNCLKNELTEDNPVTVKEVLRVIDKPYRADMWQDAIEDKKDTLGTYLKNINFNNKYDTYADSIFEEGDNQGFNEKVKQNGKFKITEEIKEKYGVGYTEEEYQAFERKYKKLTKNYTEQTSMHSEGLITYIRYRVKEEMATARGESKEAKEWGQLADKAAQAAKLNVSQLSKSDISGGVDLMTQLGEAVETKQSVIPLLPKVLEQPYDDVDLIMWSTINYNRRLEDKPQVSYRDVWNFYDEMIDEHCKQKGFTEEEKQEFIKKRESTFRDLAHIYKEPLYEEDDS